jgi:hypothetical protein
MERHMIFPTESLPASIEWATERLLASVASHMRFQQETLREAFPTILTNFVALLFGLHFKSDGALCCSAVIQQQ